jgi:DNA-binding response OmpR family regulator
MQALCHADTSNVACPVGYPYVATKEEMQILIVEDDDDALEALMALVELDGYSVEGAGSAEEALDIVALRVPQCVVLDLGLPGIDGAELARQLRSAYGNGLVLIGVTGTTDERALSEAEEAGVDFLLSKPLDIARFRRIVPPLH